MLSLFPSYKKKRYVHLYHKLWHSHRNTHILGIDAYSLIYAFTTTPTLSVFYERFPVRASLPAALQLQIVRYLLLLLLLLLLLHLHMFMYVHIVCCMERHLPHLRVARRCACACDCNKSLSTPSSCPPFGSNPSHAPFSHLWLCCSAFASRTALSIIIAACLLLFLSIYFALTSARGRHKTNINSVMEKNKMYGIKMLNFEA